MKETFVFSVKKTLGGWKYPTTGNIVLALVRQNLLCVQIMPDN